MLFVIYPFSVIISPISMRISSSTMSFIVNPFPLINISIGMNQFPIAVGFVRSPVPFIAGIIWPELMSEAITHVLEPLSCVSSSILQYYWAHLLTISIIYFLMLLFLIILILLIVAIWGTIVVFVARLEELIILVWYLNLRIIGIRLDLIA
jgi:hypothetical protein